MPFPRPLLAAALTSLFVLLPGAALASPSPAGSTVLVSRPDGTDGPLPAASDNDSYLTSNQAVSEDGTRVAFVSSADDLAPSPAQHAFVKDTTTGAVTLLDHTPDGGTSSGYASSAAISRDGTKACFVTSAGDLGVSVPDTDGGGHVYVITLATGVMELADRANGASGVVGNANANSCSLDGNGGLVAFESDADNLLGPGGDTNGSTDVFVRNLSTEVNTAESADGATLGDGDSAEPVLDDSGQTVAFSSHATNLLGPGNDTNQVEDVFQRSFVASHPTRVSVANSTDAQVEDSSSRPSISDNGDVIAYESYADDLNDGDTDTNLDIHARVGSSTVLVSRADGAAGAVANHLSQYPAVAGDGTSVAFTSDADTLGVPLPQGVEGNGALVFVRTLSTNASPDHTTVVDRASAPGNAVEDGSATESALDGDGRRAVFATFAPNLSPLATGQRSEVYLRDQQSSTTSLVSRPQADGTRPAQVDASGATQHGSVSADGRYVAFASTSPGLGATNGHSQAFVRDTLLGTTTLVSRANGAAGAIGDDSSYDTVISADGSTVAFSSNATNLGVDNPDHQDIIYVRNLAGGTTTPVSLTGAGHVGDGQSYEPTLDADGGVVGFTSSADDLVPSDTNAHYDVFVHNVASGVTRLASLAPDGSQAVGGDAQLGSIDGDGTKVAFISDATNLPGAGGGNNHVYVRDLTAGTTVQGDVTDGPSGTGENKFAQYVSLSADGNRVAFTSGAKLTADAVSPSASVFVRDLAAGTTTLASVGTDGVGNTAQPFEPALSGDGTKVVFVQQGANFPANSATGPQFFERDLAARTTTLVSAADGGSAGGDGEVDHAAVDADGGCVVFDSSADNLVAGGYGPGVDFLQVYERSVSGACPVVGPSPAPPAPPVTPIATPPVLLGPVLSAVKLSAGSWRVGAKRTVVAARAKKHRVPVGTRLSFELNEVATVKIAVTQTRKVRRKHKKARSVTSTRVTFSRRAKAGVGVFAFSGRWGSHRLSPGRYHLVVVATDALKHSSKTVTLAFKVVR